MVKTLPYSFSTKQSVLDFFKIVLKRLHFYYVNDYFFQTLHESEWNEINCTSWVNLKSCLKIENFRSTNLTQI